MAITTRKLAVPADEALDLIETLAPKLSKHTKTIRRGNTITVSTRQLIVPLKFTVTAESDCLRFEGRELSALPSWRLQDMMGDALHWNGWKEAACRSPYGIAATHHFGRVAFRMIDLDDTIRAFCTCRIKFLEMIIVTDSHVIFGLDNPDKVRLPLAEVVDVTGERVGRRWRMKIHTKDDVFVLNRIKRFNFDFVFAELTK